MHYSSGKRAYEPAVEAPPGQLELRFPTGELRTLTVSESDPVSFVLERVLKEEKRLTKAGAEQRRQEALRLLAEAERDLAFVDDSDDDSNDDDSNSDEGLDLAMVEGEGLGASGTEEEQGIPSTHPAAITDASVPIENAAAPRRSTRVRAWVEYNDQSKVPRTRVRRA